MRKPACAFLTVVAATLCLMVATPRPVSGQARWDPKTPKLPMARTWMTYKAALPPYTPPRTPDGVPDLQGTWGGPGGAGADDIEDHGYVDVTTPPQESFVSDPADGKIPYTAWALARRNEIRAGLGRGWPGESAERLYADPNTYCVAGVASRGVVGEIIQQPGLVVMVAARAHREIPTDGRAHVSDRAKLWRGNPRGRWEGNTLVVDVTGLNGKQWFDSVGNFYSENTRMVERLTMVDANTIDYEVTIEDPTIYTRPWKMNYPLRRAGTGGTDNSTGRYAWRDTVTVDRDPYAREAWEAACNEGIERNVVDMHTLGFKWFRGVTPPR
ncbi:MAG: hypothetical protein HY824_16760 [Acidobacteria bacterium]|nr:hypothetical protein [Acidobacteriota bacterium]